MAAKPTTPLRQFLGALYAASEQPIRLSYELDREVQVETGDQIVTNDQIDATVAGAGDNPIYAFAGHADGSVSFLYEVQEHARRDGWEGQTLAPTVALYRDGTMILAWALDAVAPTAEAAPVAQAMGCDLDEPIPTPGANGWEMVRCDAGAFQTLDALADAFGAEGVEAPGEAAGAGDDGAALGVYDDAQIMTPFDEADPALTRQMVISTGAHKNSTEWKPKTMTIGAFVALLCRHPENPKKDGPAFVLAEIVGPNRRKVAVRACYGVGLDIDVGTPGAVIDAQLAKLGCLAVRYTTHSHGKTRTEFKKDRLIKAAEKAGRALDEAFIFDFLREEEHWDEAILKTASYVGDEHMPEGMMALIEHAPMPKHRVVLPFAEPFVIADVAPTQDEGMRLWTQVPKALARLLGDLPLDKSGVDPSRLFYFPRHAKDKPWETALFGGPLLDWRTLDLEEKVDAFEAALVQEFDKGKGRSTTDAGKKLGRWSMKAAHGFQIADVIRDYAEDRIRTNGANKLDIECPFDSEHSNPGDPEDRACMVVNAGDGPSAVFTIKCQHDSCQDRTNLDMLGKMLADGWFAEEVLSDPDYNAAEIEDAPQPEVAKRIAEEDEAAERQAAARDSYREAIAGLNRESADNDVATAIEMVALAKLDAMPLQRARDAIAEATGLGKRTVDKEVKAAERRLAEAAKAEARERRAEARANMMESSDDFAKAIPLPNDDAAPGGGAEFLYEKRPDGEVWVAAKVWSEKAKKEVSIRLWTPWTLASAVTYPDRDGDDGFRVRHLVSAFTGLPRRTLSGFSRPRPRRRRRLPSPDWRKPSPRAASVKFTSTTT
jgi:hypothetical protein